MGYSAEDEALIKEKWDDLLLSCTKICRNDEDWNFINVHFLAKEAHEGVRRRSGEPYLLHPIAVAKIVVDEIGLGVKSVVAALLHDVVEDTEYTVEDMERIFGPKIASMVDGLTKMSGVFNADTSEQAEYFRKVLLTLVGRRSRHPDKDRRPAPQYAHVRIDAPEQTNQNHGRNHLSICAIGPSAGALLDKKTNWKTSA